MLKINLKQTIRVLDGDLDTPISLYLKMAGNGEGLLLESAEVDGRWGRYSVVAANFLLCLECKGGKLSLSIRDERLTGLTCFEGLPFDEGVKAVMAVLNLEQHYSQSSKQAAGQKSEPLPPITRALYGYFGYGTASIFEPKLISCMPLEDAEATLILPGELVLFDHLYNLIHHVSLLSEFKCPSTATFKLPAPTSVTAVTAVTAATGVTGATGVNGLNGVTGANSVSCCPSQAEYMQMVAKIKELIQEGEAIQVVASTRFSLNMQGSPFEFYRNLRRINPSPYMFYMNFAQFTLLGSSPEALVRCEGDNLHLSPIAGTRPRGSTKGEDNLFEEELAEDPKERAEHVMLVDLGRNDLGRIAQAGTVKVARFMEVEKFSHVMHLTSYLTAKILPGLTPLDVIAATFPAGTVSGAPKVRAMEIVAEQEGKCGLAARGPYGGCIGWLGLDKDKVYLDTGLTIRSLWVRNGKVNWQAGAGIVYDSDPASEWKECNNKAAAVYKAISGNDG